LRSDEQLVALFRAGSDDAFRAIHERYRARLMAYTRQMLRGGGADVEDALQDVFLRAHRALRSSDRPVALRAWLYRIAHNRCIDELRRPRPTPSELAPDAQPAFGAARETREPPAVAERSAALARLVADVRTLPSQQRSALLMRELQGLSYEELASALAISLPAVKSLLLRARTGLIDISLARETPCVEIRDELVCASDRGVRISGRARRHCAECDGCDAYRGELKRLRHGFAALTPGGPLAQLGMLFGLGGGGAAAAGGGGGAAGGALASVTVAKIAAVVCCAALITTAGRAVIDPSSTPKRPAAATRLVTSVAPPPSPARLRAARPPSVSTQAPAHEPPTTTAPPASVVPIALGVTGASGTAGIGQSAVTGPTGVIVGATGSTGATGTTGAAGVTGTVNGIGAPGVIATSTNSGPTGASGEQGAVVATANHYDTTESGAATGPSGAIGASGTPAGN